MKRCLRCRRPEVRHSNPKKRRRFRGDVCEPCAKYFRGRYVLALEEQRAVPWFDREVYGRPGPAALRPYLEALEAFFAA